MDVVRMTHISKSFPGIKALDDVSFHLRQGEILSLLGENGAGKTTLMKILYGMYNPDEGEIFYDEKPVQIHDPKDAIKLGICMVHQHFMLVPAFSIIDNIIVGIEPHRGPFVDRRKAAGDVRRMIEHYRFNLDPNTLVGNLSVGELQRVEVLKALYRQAKVLILDEPSAVLTPKEVSDLFDTLRVLKGQGTSIVIITHKLRETMSIADRVVVLRNGRVTGDDIIPAHSTTNELSSLMVGRSVNLDKRCPSKNIGEPLFSVQHLSMKEHGIEKLKNIAFEIRRGEILGVAGVEGNGQTQLLEALTGLVKPSSMDLSLDGEPLRGDAHDFLKKKIGHVPEDRITMGLVLPMSVKDNLFLGYHESADIAGHGLLRRKNIDQYADRCISAFNIKAPGRDTATKSLSGGNQQKIVMARALSRDLEVLIVAHPTRGLDVSAIEYIHQEILKFRDQGKAVLLVSADLDEVCTLSDRMIVMFEGRIVAECLPDTYSKTELGLLMTGNPVSVAKGHLNEKA